MDYGVLSESELIARFSEEIAWKERGAQDLALHMSPVEAWTLLANLQLALRDPYNAGAAAFIIRGLADQVVALLDPGPAMTEAIRRGWGETKAARGRG